MFHITFNLYHIFRWWSSCPTPQSVTSRPTPSLNFPFLGNLAMQTFFIDLSLTFMWMWSNINPMFKQTTYFPLSVLSVSAAHQFAVNRWNPQYSGLAPGAAQGQQSSSGMSSSTPAAGITIVCILRTPTTTNRNQESLDKSASCQNNLKLFAMKQRLITKLLQNQLYFWFVQLLPSKSSCPNIKVL